MTKPRSCPCRYGCVSPGEKDQNGDRRHRSVCPETRSAIITLLLRARRFNATLADGEGVPFAALAQREGVGLLFHAARPPQLSGAGYHQGDPRWAAAGRFDGREAPRALPSAACLALINGSCSALLEPDPNLKIYRSIARYARRHDQPHCGTGISPDRDIAAG